MIRKVYTVRLREIVLYEFCLDADSYKNAVEQVQQHLTDPISLNPHTVGLRYEIESITIGKNHDINYLEHTEPISDPPVRRAGTEGMEIQRGKQPKADDYQSGRRKG